MARAGVRTHTRRGPDGKPVTVQQHTRRTRGGRRRGLVSPGHAFKMFKRAYRAARKRKRLTAAVLGGLALGELGAWAGLRGVGFASATAGLLALGVAFLAGMASGVDL